MNLKIEVAWVERNVNILHKITYDEDIKSPTVATYMLHVHFVYNLHENICTWKIATP